MHSVLITEKYTMQMQLTGGGGRPRDGGGTVSGGGAMPTLIKTLDAELDRLSCEQYVGSYKSSVESCDWCAGCASVCL